MSTENITDENIDTIFPLMYDPENKSRPVISVESHRDMDYIAAVKRDGTVVINKSLSLKNNNEKNVKTWKNVVSVILIDDSVIGLLKDGSLIATGAYSEIVNNFRNIVSIVPFDKDIVGLCADGSVLIGDCKHKKVQFIKENITFISGLTRNNSNTGFWGNDYLYAIRKDGSNCWLNTNKISFSDELNDKAKKSNNIIEIRGSNDLLQLDANGQVYFNNEELSGWCEIDRIFYSRHWLAGLKNDNTVTVKFCDPRHDIPSYVKDIDLWIISKVNKWNDILEIALGYDYILGLNKNGSISYAFKDWYTKKDVGIIFDNYVLDKHIDRPWLTELESWNLF